MLGLSVKFCYMAEGTLFFSFSFHPTFLSSSSSVSKSSSCSCSSYFSCSCSCSSTSSCSCSFSSSSSFYNLSFCGIPFLIYLPPFPPFPYDSSSLLFFTILSSLSYLSLIFLFIILFFGNPFHTQFNPGHQQFSFTDPNVPPIFET